MWHGTSWTLCSLRPSFVTSGMRTALDTLYLHVVEASHRSSFTNFAPPHVEERRTLWCRDLS
jgi:hypothetical protein